MKEVTLNYFKDLVMSDNSTWEQTYGFTQGLPSFQQLHPLDPRGYGYVANSSNETTLESRSCMSTILLTLTLAIIVLLTITGNVLVIASVVLNGNLRTTTNYFIANLAIADLLLGTTVLPFSATLEVLQYWVFGQFFCDVWAAIDVLCCTASILSLCVISIDRYIGVTRPLQHARIMRHTRAVYIIILVWLLSMAISVAPLIGWKEEGDPDPRVCTVTTQPGYVLFSVAGSFYVPCLVILIVYFRIYQETVKYTKCLLSGAKLSKVDEENVVSLRIHTGRLATTDARRDSNLPDTADDDSAPDGGIPQQLLKKDIGGKRNSRLTFSNKVAKFKREKKAAKTLGIVVGVFITCWLPFFVILPLDSLCPSCSVPPLMFKLFFWLGYCNSTMNPIIYTCSSLEFRRAFLSILLCRRCRTRPRITLTEMQLRTKGPVVRHRHRMRRSHHQQQHLKLTSLQVSRCSPAAPGGPPVLAKSSGDDNSLSKPYLQCNCIIPDCGTKLGLIRYRDSRTVGKNKCPECLTNGHLHTKMMETALRHDITIYSSVDTHDTRRPYGVYSSVEHHDAHRLCGAKSKLCPNDQAGSPLASAHSSNSTLSSTSSLNSSQQTPSPPGHQVFSNMNGLCNPQTSGCEGNDGLITVSFYSLAETISCSD